MTLPLDTAFCLIAAIPAIIVIVQAKDGATRAWCGALLVCVVAIGLRHWIAPLNDLLKPGILKGVAGAAGVLAVICAVRSQHAIHGTLMIVGAALLALTALGIVG